MLLLEQRFKRLEKVEKQLRGHRKSTRRVYAEDPKESIPKEQNLNVSTVPHQVELIARAPQAAQRKEDEEQIASKVQNELEGPLSQVKQHVARFLLNQRHGPRNLREPFAAEDNGDGFFVTRVMESATEVTDPAGTFVPLFEPDIAEENREEEVLIADMINTDRQQQAARAAKGTLGQQGVPAKAARPSTAASMRSTPQFYNAKPLQIPRFNCSRPSSSKRPQTAAPLNGSRLAKAFFNSLPPVIPRHEALAKQVRPPGLTVSLHDAIPDAVPIPPFARTKEFYHLQIKIVHAVTAIENWEFAVFVTDVTNPDVTPKHQFRNLRVNHNRYLIFHPPYNIVFSAVDDLPFVTVPENLYGHTLRIEVIATFPVESRKVVDTIVRFGSSEV